VPPLRMRKDDIPALIFHFLELNGIDVEKVNISSEAWELLLKYNYPGNIRELENIVHRAIVLGNGIIKLENLPEDVRLYKKLEPDYKEQVEEKNTNKLPINLDSYLESIERSFLVDALEETSGRKKEAAKLLGMNFRSFRYRLKKYDLESDDEIISDYIN
jgi:DNA-binding NtrC family response regulator